MSSENMRAFASDNDESVGLTIAMNLLALSMSRLISSFGLALGIHSAALALSPDAILTQNGFNSPARGSAIKLDSAKSCIEFKNFILTAPGVIGDDAEPVGRWIVRPIPTAQSARSVCEPASDKSDVIIDHPAADVYGALGPYLIGVGSGNGALNSYTVDNTKTGQRLLEDKFNDEQGLSFKEENGTLKIRFFKLVPGEAKFDGYGKIKNWPELLKAMALPVNTEFSVPDCSREWKKISKHTNSFEVHLFVPVELLIGKPVQVQYLSAHVVCGLSS